MDARPTDRWATWAPSILSIVRIVAAYMFILSGTPKLFGIPVPLPDGVTITPFSQMWIGGVLEVYGGALLLLGLFTRPLAFIMSGMMAVAYWQFHAGPTPLYPTVNGGVPAVLYCFLWLYFSAAGAGPWSLDALVLGRRRTPEPTPATA
ncbi:MAG TPA: DoxX family protein [bacterium]|nr:DoxX family protein [bacterium]